jgi:methylmalonyl-CoA mutase N-terminal domain/subunit
MRDLFAGIDLAAITTSMTINSPAAVMLRHVRRPGRRVGRGARQLGGTLQNDILKEYQAQKEFVFPPRPSMRLVRDTISLHRGRDARWNSISVSGYHIREAGSTAAEELAFTLANGFAYVELARQPGWRRRGSPRGSPSSSTPTSTSSKRSPSTARPAIWATWMRTTTGDQ